MASNLVDLVKIIAGSTGTGAITLGAAAPGYRGKEILQNGLTYSYAIQQGENFEFGEGAYLSGTNQLLRSPHDSSNGGEPLDLQPNATVAFIALAKDIGGNVPGPPGPPGNSVSTLTELKALDIGASGVLLGSIVYGWQAGDFSTLVDDANYVASDTENPTIGAWVRQDAGSITFKSALGGPAILRLLRSRVGEVVSAKDYVIGDGNADDTEAYQALVNLHPAEIQYPQGCSIAVTSTVLWIGDQTHRFANNARIIGDLNSDDGSLGYAVQGQGYPDLITVTVTAPIARDALSFPVNSTAGFVVGDDIILYDSVADEYDMNTVRAIIGSSIYTKRPINYAFATAANILVYKLANACKNLNVFGGEIRNVNASDSANGIAFRYCTDIYVQGLTAYETGGIGIAPALSQRLAFDSVSAIRTGRSGFAGRWIKDFRVSNFIGRNPQRDESMTFYKNCAFGLLDSPDILQYLGGEQPSGLGEAGNCILLDDRCCDITIRDAMLRGSATYPIFVNNGSNRNRIINPKISTANLGGIRFAVSSNDNRVESGFVTDVINATDSEQSGIATAGIQDDNTCTGNVLGDGTHIARIGGNINVRQGGTRGTVINHGNVDQRGGSHALTTTDWDGSSTGSRLTATPAGATGNVRLRLVGEIAGGGDYGAVTITVRGSDPGLTSAGEVSWMVPGDNKLYPVWCDFTGTSHVGAAPVGAQGAAQADSTASTVAGAVTDLNALLAKLRSAKLLAP